MKINKSLDIDLNIISPQKHIRIHEGDIDSVDILIGVTVDDESVDLSGVTIKYDATINNYLAEQDADGSVVGDKISIPVTQNMTAMSGLLLIDVRMIQSDQILFTQTICVTVEKAVVNGSTYIDFDKITIVQRMNALEEKMDYIEELVENFDTSKLIVSANRPPEGAPIEVDVDLLRVGDTWIQSGANIVYKLVEAQYNYQPVPSAEPYHKFTWQPLNERFGVGNTEPPTTVTYQPVVYTINEVQWSWLPAPEYFKGDHYQMQVGLDDPTYYICKSGTMASTGVCTYIWREEGGSIDAYTKAETNALLADKMNLAPFNPTAAQIAAMSNGQLYGDTVNHKGVVKGVQEFYDSVYIDENTYTKTEIDNIIGAISTLSFEVVQSKPVSNIKTNVIYLIPSPSPATGNVYEEWIYVNGSWELLGLATVDLANYYTKSQIDTAIGGFRNVFIESSLPTLVSNTIRQKGIVKGDVWIYNANSYVFVGTTNSPAWERLTKTKVEVFGPSPPTTYTDRSVICPYFSGDIYIKLDGYNNFESAYVLKMVDKNPSHVNQWKLYWQKISDATYTKSEINTMIGNIETLLSQV